MLLVFMTLIVLRSEIVKILQDGKRLVIGCTRRVYTMAEELIHVPNSVSLFLTTILASLLPCQATRPVVSLPQPAWH